MDKNDYCLKFMCCYYFSDFKCEGEFQFGVEVCKSLFGMYEFFILIDDMLDCMGSGYVVMDKNCKDF